MTEAHLKKYSLALNIFQNFEAKNAWGIDSIAIFFSLIQAKEKVETRTVSSQYPWTSGIILAFEQVFFQRIFRQKCYRIFYA